MAVALANVPVRVIPYTTYTMTMTGGTASDATHKYVYTLYVSTPSGYTVYVNAITDGSGAASFPFVPQAVPGTYSVALRDYSQTAAATALATGSFIGGTA